MPKINLKAFSLLLCSQHYWLMSMPCFLTTQNYLATSPWTVLAVKAALQHFHGQIQTRRCSRIFFFIFADMIWHCFCLSVFFEDMVKQTKAKTFQAYLDSCHRRYSCVHCRAHLANHDDLISKVRVTLCDFCGTFTARIMMLFALDSHVCLFSVISRQPRTRLPVQFCVSIPSGK